MRNAAVKLNTRRRIRTCARPTRRRRGSVDVLFSVESDVFEKTDDRVLFWRDENIIYDNIRYLEHGRGSKNNRSREIYMIPRTATTATLRAESCEYCSHAASSCRTAHMEIRLFWGRRRILFFCVNFPSTCVRLRHTHDTGVHAAFCPATRDLYVYSAQGRRCGFPILEGSTLK